MKQILLKNVQPKARFLKLVASTTRLAILHTLALRKKLAVQDIAAELEMTHSAVSHQLATLVAADVLKCTKSGRNMIYSYTAAPRSKAMLKLVRTV